MATACLMIWVVGMACAMGAAWQAKFHRLVALVLSGGFRGGYSRSYSSLVVSPVVEDEGGTARPGQALEAGGLRRHRVAAAEQRPRHRRLLRRMAGPRLVRAFAEAYPQAFFIGLKAVGKEFGKEDVGALSIATVAIRRCI